jgi:hypothetical protein
MRDGEGEAGDDEEGESEPARSSRAPASERRRRRRRSPDVAAVLAILVPGLGHVYVGRLRAAGIWLIVVLLGYWAILLPGVVLHVLSIVSAQRAASADGEA